METKEGTIFLHEAARKQFCNLSSFLATKKSSLSDLGSSGSFEYLLFSDSFASRSSWRLSLRLDLQSSNFIDGCNHICSLHEFRICIAEGEVQDRDRK
jgi:hypothetical protein